MSLLDIVIIFVLFAALIGGNILMFRHLISKETNPTLRMVWTVGMILLDLVLVFLLLKQTGILGALDSVRV